MKQILRQITHVVVHHTPTPPVSFSQNFLSFSRRISPGQEDISDKWEHVTNKPPMCEEVIESIHPVNSEMDVFRHVHFPGSPFLSVTFDDNCETSNNSYVALYKDDTHKVTWGPPQISSATFFPGAGGHAPLVIKTDQLWFHFHSAGHAKPTWGVKMVIAAPVSMELSERLASWLRETETDIDPSQIFALAQKALAKTKNDLAKAQDYVTQNKEHILEELGSEKELESRSMGLWWHSITDRTVNLQTTEVYFSNRMLMPVPGMFK